MVTSDRPVAERHSSSEYAVPADAAIPPERAVTRGDATPADCAAPRGDATPPDHAASHAGSVPPAAHRPWCSTLLAVPLVVAAGLAVARSGTGVLADALGDALYAALVVLLVRFVASRRSIWTQAAAGLALCTVVELAQLTVVPATVAAAYPPARYVLGTTFVVTDLLAYAAGAVLTAAVVRAVQVVGRGGRSSGAPSGR